MLIDLSTAKAQISAEDGDPDGNLPIYIGAAEGFAAEYLQRNIYATQDALTAAIAATPEDPKAVQGIVLNDSIRAALLLIIGHLSLNREENSPGAQIYELPMGAKSFLDLYRAY